MCLRKKESKRIQNRTVLLGIGDVAVLMQYLYMDESHSVEVKNIIGVPSPSVWTSKAA